MIVVLKAPVFDKLKDDLVHLHVLKKDDDDYEGRGRHKRDRDRKDSVCEIDLTSLTRKECEHLLKLLDTCGVHGTKITAADVRKYLRASDEGIENIVARTCRQAAWMLELYFAQLPHHTIFSEDEYGGNSHSGYWVGDVNYHPENYASSYDRYKPECTVFQIFWVENDCRYMSRIKLLKGDCVQRTCEQILEGEGFVPETPKLMDKLRKETERFYQIKEQIGLQCIAHGTGLPDLNDSLKEDKERRWWRSNNINLNALGGETRVVVDVLHEGDKEERESRHVSGEPVDAYRWHNWNMRFHAPGEDELIKHLEADEDTVEPIDIDIPVHPLVPCFDLKRHCRLRVHVNNLKEYEYNRSVAEYLILPDRDWKMINLLVDHSSEAFRDIVGGKGASMNVLCEGPPGVGKTATAEIFAEFKGRPLYTIQCSQLGLNAEGVEGALRIVLTRANRWNAILLLDEADVYVRKRHEDLNQNAIVGAFLRVLEYADCILFMTTNLGDHVDDAIASRCVARLKYGVPSQADQVRIWQILSKLNGVKAEEKQLWAIATRHPELSGRDVKNLLKLIQFAGDPVTLESVEYALQFKPTATSKLKEGGENGAVARRNSVHS